MGAGGQAEHQYPSVGIAEARDRFSPIIATEVGAAFLSRNFLPIFDQPGTASAGNDFAVQLIKPGGHLYLIVSGTAMLDSCVWRGGCGHAGDFSIVFWLGLPR